MFHFRCGGPRFKMAEDKPTVGIDYVLKIEGICRDIVHQLERGEKKANHEMLLVMMIFGATRNVAYRSRLFDVWPTVTSLV